MLVSRCGENDFKEWQAARPVKNRAEFSKVGGFVANSKIMGADMTKTDVFEKDQSVDYLNEDFRVVEKELDKLETIDLLQIEINSGLEAALRDLESTKAHLSKNEGDTLIELCKTSIMDTITGQFGLASLFIDCKDGGNVTTTHNFEKGVVATEADQKKYNEYVANNDGSKEWAEVRSEYNKPLPKKRKQAFEEQEVIIDEYTGRELPKDGRSHIDHVVPVKEIEEKASAHLYMSPEQRVEMATNDKNLAWTDASANMSKNDSDMSSWINKEDKKTGKTKAEKYGINKEKALARDKEARKHIKKTITVAAIKKSTAELMTTGGKDAARMAAYTALGAVMREFTEGVFIELKITLSNRGGESSREVFDRFKNRMSKMIAELKKKWADILKGALGSGITAFFSNLLVFIVNLFATTLKKFVSMIRAGFVSLVHAVKVMANPPEGMTQEDANFQAIKIMTAGLIGALSLGLSAAIEKFLQGIPGLQPLMFFPIPSFTGEQRTVSDVLAVTISALLGGLLTTIAIYYLDKLKSGAEDSKMRVQLVYQSGVVAEYKTAQTWLVLYKAYEFIDQRARQVKDNLRNVKAELEDSSKSVSDAVDECRRLLV